MHRHLALLICTTLITGTRAEACIDYSKELQGKIVNATKIRDQSFPEGTAKNYDEARALRHDKYTFELSGFDNFEEPADSILQIKKNGSPVSHLKLRGRATSLFKTNSRNGYVVAGLWDNISHECTAYLFDKNGQRSLRLTGEHIGIVDTKNKSIIFSTYGQHKKLDAQEKNSIKKIHSVLRKKYNKIPIYIEAHNNFITYDDVVFFRGPHVSDTPISTWEKIKLKQFASSHSERVNFSVSRSYLSASSAVRLLVKTKNKQAFCKMLGRLEIDKKNEFQLEALWEFWSGFIFNEIEIINCEQIPLSSANNFRQSDEAKT